MSNPVHLWERLSQEDIACQLEHLARQAEAIWEEASVQEEMAPTILAAMRVRAHETRQAALIAAGRNNILLHVSEREVTREWDKQQ